MNPNDETLMAYADGELSAQRRAQLEESLATDETLRLRVATLRLQRSQLAAAFATVLDEPVPDRLTRLLKAPPDAALAPAKTTVVALEDARARREARRQLPTWAQWGGMAASLLLGAVLALQWSGNGAEQAMALSHGQLVATGSVAQALSDQLASEPQQGAAVAVQLSFVDKTGNYCRTFSTSSVAGLACQQDGKWAVTAVTAQDAVAGGEVRPAATNLPPSILDAVDKRIAGLALDPTGARNARDRGWRH